MELFVVIVAGIFGGIAIGRSTNGFSLGILGDAIAAVSGLVSAAYSCGSRSYR